MTRLLDRRPVCLTALSPIHVGAGEDLDWTSAVIDGDRLVPFNTLAVNLPQSALTELDRATGERDATRAILLLQRIYKKHTAAFVAAARGAAPVLPPAIAEEIRSKIGQNVQREDPRNPVASQLRIDRALTNVTSGRPLIPGSSLKGMLRTAEIARKDGEGKSTPTSPRPDANSTAVEKLVGQFAKSPFSKLSLSDLAATEGQSSLVVTARCVRRKPREREQGNKGIPVKVEAALPFVPGGFRGDVRVLKSRGTRDETPSLELASLFRTAHSFHADLFSFFRSQIELDTTRAHLKGWLDAVATLIDEIEVGKTALVRIGKYGSAESKTVAHRNVRIPQAKEREKQNVLHPYTMWLADPGKPGKPLPFGWALLELADEPSETVMQFCAAMAGTWDFGRATQSATATGEGTAQRPAAVTAAVGGSAQPPAATVGDRIVTNRAGKRELLAKLEDLHDGGRDYDVMLQNYINQSQAWPTEDRLLLARLVRDKLRAKSKLGFKWRNLEKLLLKLPD